VRAYRPGRRELQVYSLGRLELDQGDAARAHLARHRHHRDRIRGGGRADQPPLEERVELAHAQATRGHGEHVGLDLGRVGWRQLDVHRARAEVDVCVSPKVIAGFYHRPVRVRILGSAAGGGFPQWNCHCPTCEAARTGTDARPRTQSSLAIRGADGPWFLANASPDLRQQLEALAADGANGVRAAPVAGVLLTDAEIDHAAGLLLLRESSTAIRVYGSDQVRRALTDGYPVLRMLADYSGVEWQTLDPETALAIDGSSLEVQSFAAGGDAPRYLAGTGADVEATGLVFRDRSTGGVLTYVPGLARLDDDVLGRLAASDVVLVDGTFWRDDELARLGISDRTASQMGHVPLSGAGGTLEAFARLERPRVILVHINNTNPVLLERSPERDAVLRAGVEVGYDGLELEL
jgi:pyrroloquinoline quinone biosynthesis protein B